MSVFGDHEEELDIRSNSGGFQPKLRSSTHYYTIPTQQILERIESLFGSVENFQRKVVQISRLVLVDCLTYPFIVLSRQCQLFPYNPSSVSLVAPFSSIVVLHHIAKIQGISGLWRGWRSHMFLLLIRPFFKAILTKLWGRPRASVLYWLRDFLLESASHVATMPLLSHTYLEMAQTTQDKVQAELGDLLNQHQLIHLDEFRRLPYLTLAPPTILYGVSSTLIYHGISKMTHRILPAPTYSSPLLLSARSLWLDYISMFITEVTLYPLQTVLMRLYCQGMPALVDNMQNGIDTVYVSSYYKGFGDCVGGILETEGWAGFFKGFSAVLIRYVLHGVILFVIWRTVRSIENKVKR